MVYNYNQIIGRIYYIIALKDYNYINYNSFITLNRGLSNKDND
jgi:hypothetical protein